MQAFAVKLEWCHSFEQCLQLWTVRDWLPHGVFHEQMWMYKFWSLAHAVNWCQIPALSLLPVHG